MYFTQIMFLGRGGLLYPACCRLALHIYINITGFPLISAGPQVSAALFGDQIEVSASF